MRHRLYYLLPDIESARRTFDSMLLNRIEQRYVHFLGADGPLPPDLPEANFLLKTDIIHGAESGMTVGAVLGALLGFLLVYYFQLGAEAAVVLAMAIGGLLFGGWAASMVAAALPNTRLKPFYPQLGSGRVLMIADIPARRVDEIERLLAQRHPEMHFSGEDPHVPVFP